MRAHGCKVCGGSTPNRRSSAFRLCVEHTDTLFLYVGAPMTTGGTPWLGEGADTMRRRAHLMRARYQAATRLLGWETQADEARRRLAEARHLVDPSLDPEVLL